MVWIRFIWFRIGSNGGLLWRWAWTYGFHKMWGIYWPADWLCASQEALCIMEFVGWFGLVSQTCHCEWRP